MRKLTDRGLIEDGRLTPYGREVEALPVDRAWAELLLHAEPDLLPLVAGASGIDSLHRMTKEERDLHGVQVNGSDHLTAYNLLAEAVNRYGRIADIHGLQRHIFDEDGLAEWAERRGVLMKAIEDGALGMAAAYRALDVALPLTLPHATRELRQRFIDLLAQFQPFDLVIDERTIDGQDARISKTSVADSRGAVSGGIRYFADRQGVARASIEGPTIPHDVVRRHATWGPPIVMLAGGASRRGLGVSRRLQYFGFELDTGVERLDRQIPPELRSAALDVLARALRTGEVEHPSRGRIARSVRALRTTGGGLAGRCRAPMMHR